MCDGHPIDRRPLWLVLLPELFSRGVSWVRAALCCARITIRYCPHLRRGDDRPSKAHSAHGDPSRLQVEQAHIVARQRSVVDGECNVGPLLVHIALAGASIVVL